MISFYNHISEADTPFEDRTICWYLSQPNDRKLVRAVTYMEEGSVDKVHPVVRPYVKALSKWFGGRGGEKDYVPMILEMGRCPHRAEWTKFRGGTLWRGVYKSWDQIKHIEYTGRVLKLAEQDVYEAVGIYKSKYEAQSWSAIKTVAFRFSAYTAPLSEHARVGVVFELKVPPEETLFAYQTTNKLNTYGGEAEVIRISNKPEKATIYVSAKAFKDLYHKQKIETRPKLLETAVGKKNASILLATPRMKADIASPE